MEKALLKLLNSFNFDKYDVTLVLERKKGVLLEQLDRRVSVKEYRVCDCPIVFVRKLFNGLHRSVWAIFHYHRYDFSCNYATYSQIGSRLALIASANSSLYVHSNYFDAYCGNVKQVKDFFDQQGIEKFKHVIFVSNESMGKITGVYKHHSRKFKVISNLVDDKAILDSAKEKVVNKKGYGKELLLFVGRLEEESKNLTRLMQTFKLVAEQSEDFELWIIGNGKDYGLCKRLIRQYQLENRVKLIGEVLNPYPYIKMADCVVLTSNFEGYPVVYNECMVLNTPIITTIPVSDQFLDIRDCAVVVEKESKKIAEKILKMEYKQLPGVKIEFAKINQARLMAIEELIKQN